MSGEVVAPDDSVNERNTSVRDELVGIMRDEVERGSDAGAWPTAPMLADAIVAAGWRPPARVIETAEELDALPEGALIRCVLQHNQSYGEVWEKTWRNEWLKLDPADRDDGESTYDARIVFAHKYASVTVVWESGDPR